MEPERPIPTLDKDIRESENGVGMYSVTNVTKEYPKSPEDTARWTVADNNGSSN